jgi:hypothetical protein
MEFSNQSRLGAKVRGMMGLLLVCSLMSFARMAAASPPLNPACPFDFFTNVASRLLSSQLNVNLDHIQIYPTNQYTPAVHRLLQVTANILDATTTNYYPSVFRPLFWKTNEECGSVWQTNIYIAGYQYVREPLSGNDPPILNTPMDPGDGLVPFGLSGLTNNIYGIPWVIGVKKGLPNFNGFELDNTLFIERKLQFTRSDNTPNSTTRIYTTNQMYLMGVSNAFAMDDWNSYANPYNNQVTVYAQDNLAVGLTNSVGFSIVNQFSTNTGVPGLAIQPWPAQLFVLPFGTNVTVMQNLSFAPALPSTDGVYLYYGSPVPVTFGGAIFLSPCFIPSSLDPANYLDSGTPPLPQFGLMVTNHLQAYMLETDQNGNIHILDYVQLGSMTSTLNVNAAILDANENGLWSTNAFAGSTTPCGIINQYNVSSIGGVVPAEDADGGAAGGAWTTTPVPGLDGNFTVPAQQAFFSAFFSSVNIAPYAEAFVTNIQLSVLAPFTPMRAIVQRFVLQANDPLVHYLTSDLNDINDDTSDRVAISPIQTNGIKTIGILSDRYLPWGGQYPEELPWGGPDNELLPASIIFGDPAQAVMLDENQYNFAYKDPLVWSSDDWNFPTNEALNASWLGQVHRGTPWQTIYLKSSNILDLTLEVGSGQTQSGAATWQVWTGDLNPTDAASMAPIQDWRIAGLLASLFNTNSEASLFSPNDPNPRDWENLLNGMTILTNDAINDIVVAFDGPQFATLTISSASVQAAVIGNAIESTRSSLPGQLFNEPGSVFAVPQLSADSPYLNLDAAEMDYGISDLAYEAIPDQLLALLRVDSIGSMTASNGRVVIQFTGDENHAYAVQSSPNLVNWTTLSTNCPVNGIFAFTNNVTANAQFYRTVLLR